MQLEAYVYIYCCDYIPTFLLLVSGLMADTITVAKLRDEFVLFPGVIKLRDIIPEQWHKQTKVEYAHFLYNIIMSLFNHYFTLTVKNL